MATKTINKQATKKSGVSKNLDKIQKTVKSVNKEMVKTAAEVVEDIQENGKELKTLASKTVKEASQKINFDDTVEMIRKTTNSVNAQVWKTVEEVLEDVAENGKEVVEKVSKKAKEAIDKVDVEEGLNKVKKTTANINKFTLDTAEEIVDGVFANGEKWQKVGAKAMAGGLKLAEQQQDIIFTTLETVKGQLKESTKRFKKLLQK